ncbi:MAG: 16S rRNA (cytidine(1402)-2'-O)-methyltransferase [Anaerolineae bacterium]|nr:16S rRNA (cytidine(1402)-2'-O)-methyltransferase [Anaerolineae bacterium]MDW8070620.1 16S rRNA (cytidine(1402)-2'-O)-methyltransferase [Anaerolineae bacterium]
MGILYLVATPIGNLEDITLRALRILRECDLIATEDTRTTGRLLTHFGIEKPLLSYFEHNKLQRLDQLLETLRRGNVALVSEAGTPLFSDPGYELVRAALAEGIPVVPVPGPSAIITALSVSGLPSDRFFFLGFLPRRAASRRALLDEVSGIRATLVCFEAPHRLYETLADMQAILGGSRPCAICRELTKRHEEVWRGTLAEAYAVWKERQPRGEFTLVVGGASPSVAWDETRVREALASLLSQGIDRSTAARQVARVSGWSRRAVYTLALQTSPQPEEGGEETSLY